jgi:hypothetical protein
MKNHSKLTIFGLFCASSLYGQMDYTMNSPNSKIDKSNKPVMEPMQEMPPPMQKIPIQDSQKSWEGSKNEDRSWMEM